MKFCPSCGSRVQKSATVCERCGARLIPGAAPKKWSPEDCFPFKTMRPSQKEVLQQVEAALGKWRFIILEAPVGFGKSAIAASLCSFSGSAYLLTSTKQLQDQYSADFRLNVVMGKSNFTCLVPTSLGKLLPCSKGRCEVDWKLSDCPHHLTFQEYDEHRRDLCTKDSKCRRLKDDKLCPYYDQKWDAFSSPVTVANYPFFLTELRHTDDIRRRKVLVCDECHDLERQLVSSASFTLRRSTVESYSLRDVSGPERFTLPDLGLESASAYGETLNNAKLRLEAFLSAYLGNDSMQERVAGCRNALESIAGFIEDLESHPDNWVVNSLRKIATSEGGPSVEEVDFQPLEVGAYTSSVFETAETVLLMSATVFSKEAFCRSLGIPVEQAWFIRVGDSSFPVENRRVHVLNAARLNRASLDASLETIARAVDEIMVNHIGERGIVHTTSYQQARYIMDHVSDSSRNRLSTTEGASSRSALLKTHGSTDESVLISPSLYQGVDLKDELSRFQVLVKVPYPDLSERRTRVKLERDPAWYDWQTALRLVQTYGRSVRSETDHAVTYVLDSNFTIFLGRHRDLFPEYFLEALVTNESTRE